MLRKLRKILLISFILFFLIVLVFYLGNGIIFLNTFSSKESLEIKDSIVYLNSDETVKIVNLQQSLSLEYDDIECRHSFGYKQLYPLFCVHDSQKDLISGILWKDQVFEREILGDLFILFLKILILSIHCYILLRKNSDEFKH